MTCVSYPAVINSYLAESTNTTADLQCITNNIQRTVTRKLDVPPHRPFTYVEGVFNRVVPEGTHAEVFLQIRQEIAWLLRPFKTGRRQFVPLERIPDKGRSGPAVYGRKNISQYACAQ